MKNGLVYFRASQVTLLVKNAPVMQEMQETWVQSLGREGPLEEGMTSTPVFLPGKPQEQRNQLGYSLGGLEESELTEHTQNRILKKKKKTLCIFTWVLDGYVQMQSLWEGRGIRQDPVISQRHSYFHRG